MTALIRPIGPDDFDTILTLNQGALEGVGTLDLGRLGHLVDIAHDGLVAEVEGQIAGFAITMATGTAYDSINFAWFEQRYAQHTYLDRIVVAPAHRRLGIASQLYDVVERELPVTLEVYAVPPNLPSLAFHAARGYREVGQLAQDNGKTAAMFVKA